MLIFCFAEAVGIIFGYYTDIGASFLCVFAVLSIFGAYAFCRSRTFFTRDCIFVCFSVIFFCMGFATLRCAEASESALAPLAGEVADISGTVLSVRERDSYTELSVKTRTEKVQVRAKGCPMNSYALVGRSFRCRGEISIPDGRRNPGAFDYALHLRARGIRAICSASKYRWEAGKVEYPFLNFLSLKKGEFLEAARGCLREEEIGIISGVLFGDKALMDEEVYQSFRRSGVAHILAVSGLHVGLLYSVAMKVLGGRRTVRTSLICSFLLFLYVALAGFSVSAVRAVFMIFLHMAAFHLRRRYDLLSAASVTGIFFMTVRPFLIFDSGAQLSFTAVYIIGSALPWLKLKLPELSDRYKNPWIGKVGNAVLPGIMIQLGMAPIIAFHFLSFPPLAFLVNPFAIAVAGLLLPCGLLMFVLELFMGGMRELFGILGAGESAAAAGGFGDIASAVLGEAARLAMAAVSGTLGALARLLVRICAPGTRPGASFDAPAPPFATLALFYISFFWFFSESRYILHRLEKKRALAAAEAALICLGIFAPPLLGITKTFIPWDHGLPAVTFLDVGQGDCIHIHYKNSDILIDGGGSRHSNIAEKVLKPYLLKNGVGRIDLAVPTHRDIDHCLGLEQLAEIMPVELCEPGSFRAGDVIEIAEGVKLSALWPPFRTSPEESDNNLSAVFMLEYDGLRLLLTGDIESDAELALASASRELSCDLIKIAHHGSGSSTGEGFLSAADPSIAVISCGRNNSYGHPAARVLDLLRSEEIDCLRTDLGGAILLYIRNGRGRALTMLPRRGAL